MMGLCYHKNGSSVSIKGKEFIDQLSDCEILRSILFRGISRKTPILGKGVMVSWVRIVLRTFYVCVYFTLARLILLITTNCLCQ